MPGTGTIPNDSGVGKCHVFTPTIDEFVDFSRYIKSIETNYPDIAICKVIPPKGWFPRKSDYTEVESWEIAHPIEQVKTGLGGIFSQLNMSKGPISVRDFKRLAESKEFRTPPHPDVDSLDREFWRTVQ